MKILGFRVTIVFHVILLVPVLLALSPNAPAAGSYNFIRCGECDESRCPELHYCEGQAIKDHCGCCTVCSSSKFQPHVMIAQQPAGNACDQVKCPKLKVCVVNMQGLPLCTCPSLYICRTAKKKEVCGTDGQSYESRCHMRIAACEEGVTVRKKHRGACTETSLDTEDQEDVSQTRKGIKKDKNGRRRRRKDEGEDDLESRQEKRRRRKDEGEDDLESRQEKRRRRRERRRKRRRSGRSRSRRHRGKNQVSGKTFEEAFSHYTWQA